MKAGEVSHTGRIISINQYVTEVEIVRASACGDCHARKLCGFSEDEKKIVPVPTNAFDMYNVGDVVEICTKLSMGMKAVWICYVIPLIVLMAVICALTYFGMQELTVGLSAIAAVVLYYALIFCFRKKLNNEFVFYIKGKNE